MSKGVKEPKQLKNLSKMQKKYMAINMIIQKVFILMTIQILLLFVKIMVNLNKKLLIIYKAKVVTNVQILLGL